MPDAACQAKSPVLHRACWWAGLESVQGVVQDFVDDACRDGDQDQISAGLLPLIAVIVR